MGRKSTKENKSIYQTTREELGLTRERAAELIPGFSPERIEKIENDIAAENDKLTLIAFKALKTGIDDSFAAHEVFRTSGQKGAAKKKEKAAAEKAALEKYGTAEPEPQPVSHWQNGKGA